MAKLRSKGKRTAFGGPTKANSVANNVNAKAGTPKSVKINEKKTGDNREVQKEEKVENTPTTELDNKVENAAEEGSDKKVEQTPKPNKNKKRLRKKKKISAEHPAAASKDVSLPETSAAKKDPKKDNIMGLIFMCNAQTKKECFQHKILGLPASKKDIVAKVFKGMKLFLFDIDLRLMYGIYKASSPGGYDIKPKAFKSAFPSQVRFEVWDDCLPLPEERFKGAIKENYFARNKFDCVLTAKQVKDLTKLFKPARDSKRDGRVHQTMIPRSTDRYSKRERDNNRTRFSPVNDDRRRRARREVYYREADREAYQSQPLHPSLPPPLPQYLPAALPQYLPAVLPHAYERLPPPQIDYYRVDPQLELRNHQLGALRRDPPLELRDRQLQDWQRDPQLELHDPPLRDMQLEPQLVRRDRQLMALHQEPQPEYHIRQVAPPLDNSNSRFADLHRDSQLELREQVMLRNLQREPQLDLYDHQGLDLQLRPQDRIGLQSSYISQRNVMPYHDSLFSAGLSQDYNRNGYY